MIRVSEFSKKYDQFVAVDRLSFEVGEGEILGLVGPNGAGKTTTLRALAGILAPTAGQLEVCGHDLAVDPIGGKRLLAYVPDTPHPFDMLTVEEHLRFTAMAYRVEDPEPRYESWLAEMELLEKRNALATTLSRGMQQKLAIACAFLHDPRVILLDEPLTGLDPRGIRGMRDSIQRRADLGAAVLVSSHLLELVERLCDRVLILDRGQALAQGTLDQIRAVSATPDDATLEEVFFAITERSGHQDGSGEQAGAGGADRTS